MMEQLLTTLLGEVGVPRFRDEFFERRPLHVPGQPQRVTGLLSSKEFVDGLRAAVKGGPGMVDLVSRDSDGNVCEQRLTDSAQVEEALQFGQTLVGHQFPARQPGVRALIRNLRDQLGLAGNTRVAAFFSRDGHGFGMHFDSMSVFVLQLEGTKIWTVSEEPGLEGPWGRHVLQATVPDDTDNDPALVEEITFPEHLKLRELKLTAGDFLYLPPGIWHSPVAEGSSLALSIGFTKVNPLVLVMDTIGRNLMMRASFRCNVPQDPNAPPHAFSKTQRAYLNDRLAELRRYVGVLTADDLYESWWQYLNWPDD